MPVLTEEIDAVDSINVISGGSLEIREATYIARDGVRDLATRRYNRYVLHPGDDVTGRDPRIVAVAKAVWTRSVVAAYQARVAAAAAEAEG